MISGIYCIENLINGKKYIGFSTDIYKRWKIHVTSLDGNYHENWYLQNAWNKYKKESFMFKIIEEYPPVEEILKLMEIYFISYYNSFRGNGKGYNLTKGGEGNLGWIPTKKARRNMSKANSGENNPNYGKHPSPETLEKQSKGNKGKIISPETRKKISISATGRIHSPESIKKTADARRGTHLSPKTKKKIGDANLGKKRVRASSPFYGVSKHGNENWQANIWVKGKYNYIGIFKIEIDAAKAYDKYVIENNLPRSLNFPNDISN